MAQLPKKIYLVIFLTLGISLSGCIGTNRREMARQVAAGAMTGSQVIPTDTFDLLAYTRFDKPHAPLTIYIEGDGMAWISRTTLSDDPTPRQPMALEMAILDLSANVAYLGRPCQYVTDSHRRNCQPDYWSTSRFAEEVIAATDQAIERLKTESQADNLQLVGYSGGGAVAVLVAARRNDVVGIRTVAGNLDHSAFTDHHGVTPLSGSLNPLDVRQNLAIIPQIHFVGDQDRTIPPFIAESFVRTANKGFCAKVEIVPGMKHGSEWNRLWPSLLSYPYPHCGQEVK